MKIRGRNTFSSFLLKYRGRNYTNFPETWKRWGGRNGGAYVVTFIVWVPPTDMFSCAKSTPARILLTNALGENRQFSLQNMFILCPFNSPIVRYYPSKFAHMCLGGIRYRWLWPNWCKGNSFGDIDAINWENACCGPYGTSAWPHNLHEPFWFWCSSRKNPRGQGITCDGWGMHRGRKLQPRYSRLAWVNRWSID